MSLNVLTDPHLDLLLMVVLGFLGSFGHCGGMCGPLVMTLALAQPFSGSWWQTWRFHLLLNLARLGSYALLGSLMGWLGSVLIAGGQLAGVGSGGRQMITAVTGLVLTLAGLSQLGWMAAVGSVLLPKSWREKSHQWISQLLQEWSQSPSAWTPLGLGLLWGGIPCGFLYVAQIKAAESGTAGEGALTMLAFGLGTLPVMVGLGVAVAGWGADRRSQLYRLAGGITLLTGVMLLLRTSAMQDVSGYASLLLLMLALIARPLRNLWPSLLRYRRVWGVGGVSLATIHTLHHLDHSLAWNVAAILFLLPMHQVGVACGVGALLLLLPGLVTSTDSWQKKLALHWRKLHLLSLPALLLAVAHSVLLGSRFWGSLQPQWSNHLAVMGLGGLTGLVFLVRWRWLWSWVGKGAEYGEVVGRPEVAVRSGDRCH
ncbi:MAG: sulfite exporter TauE/SafE family protein [Cyanobacteriota bacterium]|nr:sulfite exporter TauE/SafE family protein [Cyanobacteriota bacterium]